jgi:hypothetical protein
MSTCWYNVHPENLPEPGKEVLISVNGVDHVATYDAERRVFRVADESGVTFALNSGSIYWTELQRTGTSG